MGKLTLCFHPFPPSSPFILETSAWNTLSYWSQITCRFLLSGDLKKWARTTLEGDSLTGGNDQRLEIYTFHCFPVTDICLWWRKEKKRVAWFMVSELQNHTFTKICVLDGNLFCVESKTEIFTDWFINLMHRYRCIWSYKDVFEEGKEQETEILLFLRLNVSRTLILNSGICSLVAICEVSY